MSQNPQLKTFLDSIKGKDTPTRADLFEIEAMESGGSIKPPKSSDWPSPHAFTIDLHGIHMTGATMREAMMKWERTKRRCLVGEPNQTHTRPLMGRTEMLLP